MVQLLKDAFLPFGLAAIAQMENASSICFTDPESKAFLCMQEEKDEEEWKETYINIFM